MSVHLLDRDEATDGADHAPDLGPGLLHHHVADPLEAERTQRVPLVGLAADLRLRLRDLQPAHHALTPARALSSAAGGTASNSRPRTGPPAPRPASPRRA